MVYERPSYTKAEYIASPACCAGDKSIPMQKDGLPGGTRTLNLLLRRQLLYPVELRAESANAHGKVSAHCQQLVLATERSGYQGTRVHQGLTLDLQVAVLPSLLLTQIVFPVVQPRNISNNRLRCCVVRKPAHRAARSHQRQQGCHQQRNQRLLHNGLSFSESWENLCVVHEARRKLCRSPAASPPALQHWVSHFPAFFVSITSSPAT